ncbi:XdhC family protein [Sanguibacter antarcticus]|uniref:Xanthine dehydrogenase accessory factor n=1 Tax=Sanguibacter antarcticus TaxID=372484 RepID=A0A2A9E9L2_9MICO|nr:XdhC/CoxI family protein [Sanguibacter antarcticus]PFG34942.1 xanthine dehydrogenase accessory factor [Sanguibacter antarcticus]
MFDVAGTLLDVVATGRRAAVATVVGVRGSAPRPAGASMVVLDDGSVVGSVSGGCVEGAVYEAALDILDGGPPVRETYGISDADAIGVGLTCGGEIEVFVALLPPAGAWLGPLRAAREGLAASLSLVVDGPPAMLGTFVGDDACDALGAPGAPVKVFRELSRPPARLIVCGANDFGVALTEAAAFVGYSVTVCDARPVFATPDRFPRARDVVVSWPHAYLAGELAAETIDDRTVVCVLTHDPKFDVPLLAAALRMPVAFVGAMGSRRTHTDRVAALVEAGVTEDELGRLHSPIGLDIGGSTPQETAVAILAEILAVRAGASGVPLRALDGPVHRTSSRARPIVA